MALYDRIGRSYDDTRRADPYILGRLVHHLGPARGGIYLDVGCGTGNYTAALSQRRLAMIGFDASQTMIAKAVGKAPDVRWAIALADAMPFASGSFAGAVSTLTHHHFPDVRGAFAETFRALAPNARFVIFSFTAEQMRGYWLNEYFPRGMAKSIEQCERLHTIEQLESVGFRRIFTEPYEVTDDLQDLFMYCGKNQPALYLDPRIRAGISYFSANNDPKEIAHGCARLAKDIESGRINDVIKSYAHDRGDYTFYVATRP